MGKDSTNPYKVFHSSCGALRKSLHTVLVRPEQGGNVGSIARALANMGMEGTLRVVGSPDIINAEARKMAVHAQDRLDAIQYYPTLEAALADKKPGALSLAATARIGSPSRPHPLWVRSAVERAMGKLSQGEVSELYFVFGPESDGLSNEDVALCDWVVTIPSMDSYRSLNLAQAALVFFYEANMNLVHEWQTFKSARPSQKERLVSHILQLAEEVGFILPGDPFKMRPRLEEIFSQLPNHLKEVKTLHGLLDQVIRSVRKGGADLKGRFKKFGAEHYGEQREEH